jgi:hypothetical protein
MRTPETDIQIISFMLIRADLENTTCNTIKELCQIAGYTALEEAQFLDKWRDHSRAREGAIGFEDQPDWDSLNLAEKIRVRYEKLNHFLYVLRNSV